VLASHTDVPTSLGLGFSLDVRWLFPLTAVFLLVAVVALGSRAHRRSGFRPFVVGLGASVVVLVGRFAFESHLAMCAGLGLLHRCIDWNTWPKRATAACPALHHRRACITT
jgi:hypothetical protein